MFSARYGCSFFRCISAHYTKQIQANEAVPLVVAGGSVANNSQHRHNHRTRGKGFKNS